MTTHSSILALYSIIPQRSLAGYRQRISKSRTRLKLLSRHTCIGVWVERTDQSDLCVHTKQIAFQGYIYFLVHWLSHVRLWPMDCCCTRGFPVLHSLPEFAQTHVHWLSDAIQPSNPLSPSSALSLSQNQHLFQWVGCLHQVAKGIGASTSASVLLMNIQGWFPLGLTFILRYINLTCYHFLLSEPITDLVAEWDCICRVWSPS